MYTRKEESPFKFGQFARLTLAASSPGLRVRFIKDCPLDALGVYTLGYPHHVIRATRIGYVAASMVEGAELNLKFRRRNIFKIPYDMLEVMPSESDETQAILAEGVYIAPGYPIPADATTLRFKAEVRLLAPLPVNTKSFTVLNTQIKPHHFVKAGTIGTASEIRTYGFTLTIPGRLRPIRNVPYDFAEILNLGSLDGPANPPTENKS